MIQRVLALCALTFLLSACATPEQQAAARQQQLESDADNCASYGFKPATDGFRNCMLQIDLARQQRYTYDDYYSRPHFGLAYGHFH